jgi:hypothetical protein
MSKDSLARRPRPDRSWRRALAPGSPTWTHGAPPIRSREELAEIRLRVKQVEADYGRRSPVAQRARGAFAAVRRESRRAETEINRLLAELEGRQS